MEYRIGTGQKIGYLFLALLFAGGGVALAVYAIRTGLPASSVFLLQLIGAAALFGIAVCFYLETQRLLVIVDEQARSLTVNHAFSSRSILFEQIDGFRHGEKNTFNIFVKEGKTLQLPQGLDDRSLLIAWFETNYKDLDAVELEAETKVLLQNEEFGTTAEDRADRLAGAKRWEAVTTSVGFGSFFWVLIYPKPFEIVMLFLLAAPWAGVYATWKYQGLMKLYRKKNSPYPSAVYLMVFSSLGAMIRVLLEYDLYSFTNRMVVLIGGGMVLAALVCIVACWKAIVNEGNKAAVIACIFGIAIIYSYSTITFANCYYDKSEPENFNVKVIGKRVSHGKSTSYYLTLTAWGKYRDGTEFRVPHSLYDRVSEQDYIHAYLRKGKLDIPWYWISD
ncbi:MAG: hypothetical protein JST68_20130 [Bacteroidetes bacterium]|nr:hypothetical protein [Bacteroidota bacterium]